MQCTARGADRGGERHSPDGSRVSSGGLRYEEELPLRWRRDGGRWEHRSRTELASAAEAGAVGDGCCERERRGRLAAETKWGVRTGGGRGAG